MSKELNRDMNQEEESGKVSQDPQMEKEIESYTYGMLNLLYDKKTGPAIYEMLKAAPLRRVYPKQL